jgi:hypothetical protein
MRIEVSGIVVYFLSLQTIADVLQNATKTTTRMERTEWRMLRQSRCCDPQRFDFSVIGSGRPSRNTMRLGKRAGWRKPERSFALQG